MLTIIRRLPADTGADLRLPLPFQLRSKSRLHTATADGEEVGLFLDRGTILRNGDRLQAEDGRIVEIVAAPEEVSTVHTTDTLALARACYHLGNRHVALQIGTGWVRYQQDHVLDAMVQGLGLAVTVEHAPFEPEGGAYAGHLLQVQPHHHHG